jgi:DnaJ-class molecular chaperone
MSWPEDDPAMDDEPNEEEWNEAMEYREPLLCVRCNGAGEGMFDGSRCSSCGGSGVERIEGDDDEE